MTHPRLPALAAPTQFNIRFIEHCVFLFPLEAVLQLDVLSPAPLLAVVAGMVFLIKAGILSGSFYVQAVALFLISVVMARYPDIALTLFGVDSEACFFFSGLKYYRRRKSQVDSRSV